MLEYTFWDIVTDIFLLFISPIILGLIPGMILNALISTPSGGYQKLLKLRSEHPNLLFLIYYIIGILILWSLGKENFENIFPNLYLFFYDNFLSMVTFPFQILRLS